METNKIKEYINDIKKSAQKNADFESFIKTNNVPSKAIEQNIIRVQTFVEDRKLCEGCNGLSSCKKDNVGFQIYLEYKRGKIFQTAGLCQFAKLATVDSDIKTNFIYDDFANQDYGMNLHKDVFTNEHRKELLKHLSSLLSGNDESGIYLFGTFGIGKTFISRLLANELSKHGKTIAFANMPSLCSKFKNSNFQNSDVISKLVRADYLFLDDIGGEDGISWFRNELYVIIEQRTSANRPIIYTSNFNLLDLAKHYAAESKKIIQKDTRTLRMIDRIRNSVRVFELKGENMRVQKNKNAH